MAPILCQVGRPLRPIPPIEAPKEGYGWYSHADLGHLLVIGVAKPSPDEVKAVENGGCEWTLTPLRHSIVFTVSFGRRLFFDASHAWHRVPVPLRIAPKDMSSSPYRAGFSVVFTDSRDHTVRVIREGSWSPEFSATVHGALRGQLSRCRDEDSAEAFAEIERFYARHGDPVKLARVAPHRSKRSA